MGDNGNYSENNNKTSKLKNDVQNFAPKMKKNGKKGNASKPSVKKDSALFGENSLTYSEDTLSRANINRLNKVNNQLFPNTSNTTDFEEIDNYAKDDQYYSDFEVMTNVMLTGITSETPRKNSTRNTHNINNENTTKVNYNNIFDKTSAVSKPTLPVPTLAYPPTIAMNNIS